MPRTPTAPEKVSAIVAVQGALRRWRTELCIALAAVVVENLLRHLAGVAAGTELALLAALGLWLVPTSRRVIGERLAGAHRARRWDKALAAAYPGLTPRATRVSADPFGERAWVGVAAGGTVTRLELGVEALAAVLGVAEVRVRRHPDHAGVAELVALRTDPLSQPAPPWPWAGAARTCLWEPIPLGVGESGEEICITLPEHNLLLGGEPGAGKSGALSLLVAAAALDPAVTLWLLDGKLVELAAWRGSAAGFAGSDIFEATQLLRRLCALTDERYETLLASGRRKVERSDGLHVVVCDELAHYLTWGDRKARDAFTDALRDLVSRGRAAGVIVLAATQKPGSDVVPTSLRDLFGYRLAMRCATAAASDTILGSGWATEGYSAASVSPQTRGVGFLLHESGVPQRLRTHWADDGLVARLAARAALLRAPSDSETASDAEAGDGGEDAEGREDSDGGNAS